MSGTTTPHPVRLFIWSLAASAVFAGRSPAQTTVTFDTAQQYTSNFNEILDRTFDDPAAADYLDWAMPGDVLLQTPNRGAFTPTTAGAALYNPNASTTTTGPIFTTGTFAGDFATTVLITSNQTLGLLADVQTDGHGVFASFAPALQNTTRVTTVSIAYGLFNTVTPTVDGTIYTTTVAFLPTHAVLSQMMIGGSPAFDFVLSDATGDASDSGWVSLTQTNLYNAGGETGFRMTAGAFVTDSVDNFFVSPTVVPEPGPSGWCALFALGWAGLARRRADYRSSIGVTVSPTGVPSYWLSGR